MALFFESAWGFTFGSFSCLVAGFSGLAVRCNGGLCIAVFWFFWLCFPSVLLGFEFSCYYLRLLCFLSVCRGVL